MLHWYMVSKTLKCKKVFCDVITSVLYNILKPIVLYTISEKIKQIHQRKPEISLILYDYIIFLLHN